MSAEWYLKTDGETFGPYTAKELKHAAASGKIKPTTWIGTGEPRKWMEAAKVHGLFPVTQHDDSLRQAGMGMNEAPSSIFWGPPQGTQTPPSAVYSPVEDDRPSPATSWPEPWEDDVDAKVKTNIDHPQSSGVQLSPTALAIIFVLLIVIAAFVVNEWRKRSEVVDAVVAESHKVQTPPTFRKELFDKVHREALSFDGRTMPKQLNLEIDVIEHAVQSKEEKDLFDLFVFMRNIQIGISALKEARDATQKTIDHKYDLQRQLPSMPGQFKRPYESVIKAISEIEAAAKAGLVLVDFYDPGLSNDVNFSGASIPSPGRFLNASGRVVKQRLDPVIKELVVCPRLIDKCQRGIQAF